MSTSATLKDRHKVKKKENRTWPKIRISHFKIMVINFFSLIQRSIYNSNIFIHTVFNMQPFSQKLIKGHHNEKSIKYSSNECFFKNAHTVVIILRWKWKKSKISEILSQQMMFFQWILFSIKFKGWHIKNESQNQLGLNWMRTKFGHYFLFLLQI